MGEIIINTCVALSLILLWIDTPLFIDVREYIKIDRKPFNCTTCVSFWTAIALVFINQELFYFSLPLFARVIEKKLL